MDKKDIETDKELEQVDNSPSYFLIARYCINLPCINIYFSFQLIPWAVLPGGTSEHLVGEMRDHPSICDTNEHQTQPYVLWKYFFVDHLVLFACITFIQQLTLTCHSCCFLLEPLSVNHLVRWHLKNHTPSVRKAKKNAKWIDLRYLFNSLTFHVWIPKLHDIP